MYTFLILMALTCGAFGATTFSDCDPTGMGHILNATFSPAVINLDETFTVTATATMTAGHPSLNDSVLVLTAGYRLFGKDLYVCKDGDSPILPKGTCIIDFCTLVILGDAMCPLFNLPTQTVGNVKQTVGPIKLPAILEPFLCSSWDITAVIKSKDLSTEYACLQISDLQVKDNHCLDADRMKKRRDLESKLLQLSAAKNDCLIEPC